MRARAALCVILVCSTLSGCGFSGLYGAPLPGGAELGDRPFRVTAEFDDVLDLVPQAAVKINDVAVGRIERIDLSADNRTAIVVMLVNGDVTMPANSDARLRQSSLLGEKFVELSAPRAAPRGDLADVGRIPLSRTNRNPQVEEVLGALSMLLNGGGVEQLQVIVREFNRTLSGNEAEIKQLLSTLDETVGRLDAQKENITRAIDGLNRLSATLRAQNQHIETALQDMGPGLRVVDEQRAQLVTMLQSIDRLSTVATSTIDQSRDDMIANLHAIGPTLHKLNETGQDLPKAIGYLATYPFPEYAMKPLKGDFVNLDVEFDLNLSRVLDNLTRAPGPLIPIPGINDAGQPLLPLPTAPPSGVPAPAPAPPPPPADGGFLDGLLGGS